MAITRTRPSGKALHLNVTLLSADAITPRKSHATDAGFDLFLTGNTALAPGELHRINLHIALGLPAGWYGQILGRSSSFARGLIVHPGVVDEEYRGPILVLVQNQSNRRLLLLKGDRIAQLLLLPVPRAEINVVEAKQLGSTARGHGGFGSTGR